MSNEQWCGKSSDDMIAQINSINDPKLKRKTETDLINWINKGGRHSCDLKEKSFIDEFINTINSIKNELLNFQFDLGGLDKTISSFLSTVKSDILSIIDINDNEKILSQFNKTNKGKIFIENIRKYSRLSPEELINIIKDTSESFDIPVNRLVSILIGESNPAIKGNPFKVNEKGVGQFVGNTFSDLYKKGVISNYFQSKGYSKYANFLNDLNINNLSDRQNPEKSINAIGAYLKYISIVRDVTAETAVAMYNVGPFGSIKDHLEHNPIIKPIYKKKFGNKKPTTNTLLIAAKEYYGQYT